MTTNDAIPPTAPRRPGTLFGIPIGELGWFASLLMGTAAGFSAFFAATFVAIITLLFVNALGHHSVDYAIAYRRIGLPIGLLVLASAYIFLGVMWSRRMLRRS